jgi:hypothetical protein
MKNDKMRFFRQAEEYHEPLALLHSRWTGRTSEKNEISSAINCLHSRQSAVDWGAATGTLTRVLEESFDQVFAVEPNPSLATLLRTGRPSTTTVFESTILDTELPSRVDFATLIHVLYHVPVKDWVPTIVHAANLLTDDGVLLVILKSVTTSDNGMIEYFGGKRWDLHSTASELARHPEFSLEYRVMPGIIEPRTLDEAILLARFFMSDPPEHSLTRLPSEKEFIEWVDRNLWRPSQAGTHWRHDPVVLEVSRNFEWLGQVK